MCNLYNLKNIFAFYSFLCHSLERLFKSISEEKAGRIMPRYIWFLHFVVFAIIGSFIINDLLGGSSVPSFLVIYVIFEIPDFLENEKDLKKEKEEMLRSKNITTFEA